jgi:hypothetical protein
LINDEEAMSLPTELAHRGGQSACMNPEAGSTGALKEEKYGN